MFHAEQSDKENEMTSSPQIDTLADQSKIVFIGTVQRLAASTVPTHPATSHSVVVKVNRTIQVPPALGDLTGQNITVELTAAPGLRPGQQAIFFANGLIYANSLVVQETGRLQPAPGPAARQAQIADINRAYQTIPDRHIKRRLGTADVVITGKVISTRKAPVAPGPISEHDPDWREAVIDVESVDSGPPMKQVVLYFPASRDIRWRQAPKFAVGDEGVWILHQQALKELPNPGYTALSPLDFHPKARRSYIHALIQGRR
jgi:hypothetical protein